jgi:hypothetical protein
MAEIAYQPSYAEIDKRPASCEASLFDLLVTGTTRLNRHLGRSH